MKKNCIRVSNWLLAMAMGALGFVGCSEDKPYMYGTPNADYIVSGKVTDSENNPVQGVEVSPEHYGYSFSELRDTTDKEGNYKIEDLRTFPREFYKLKFRNIDKSSAFQDKTDSVKVEKTVGGDGWYHGKAELTLDTELENKKTE